MKLFLHQIFLLPFVCSVHFHFFSCFRWMLHNSPAFSHYWFFCLFVHGIECYYGPSCICTVLNQGTFLCEVRIPQSTYCSDVHMWMAPPAKDMVHPHLHVCWKTHHLSSSEVSAKYCTNLIQASLHGLFRIIVLRQWRWSRIELNSTQNILQILAHAEFANC